MPLVGKRLAAQGKRLPPVGKRLPSHGKGLPLGGKRLPSHGKGLPLHGKRLPSGGKRYGCQNDGCIFNSGDIKVLFWAANLGKTQ